MIPLYGYLCFTMVFLVALYVVSVFYRAFKIERVKYQARNKRKI